MSTNPEVIKAQAVIDFLTDQLHLAREHLATLVFDVPAPGTKCDNDSEWTQRPHDDDVQFYGDTLRSDYGYEEDRLPLLCGHCRADADRRDRLSRRRQQALEKVRPRVNARTYSAFTSPTGFVHVFVDEPDPAGSRLLCRGVEINKIDKWTAGEIIRDGDDTAVITCQTCRHKFADPGRDARLDGTYWEREE